MFAIRLIGVLALVALNGFFASAEFSLVAASPAFASSFVRATRAPASSKSF